jgi:tRNA U34 5-methylaminomethyl-2-thiouridine-forming methyltransferase MnmC
MPTKINLAVVEAKVEICQMKEIVVTRDGSHTLSIPEKGVTYHSVHGAIQESRHVFIEAGLKHLLNQTDAEQISILEMGFGTGLNALLTAMEVEGTETSVYYVALEPFPISVEEAALLNYCGQLDHEDLYQDFIRMHQCEWNKSFAFTKNFFLHKSGKTLQTFEHTTGFDLIYYDAFAPAAQPELWTKEIFAKLFSLLKQNGILVTYCSKGDVRRAMQAAGFVVKKLPGPPGKREMLRAEKK